MTQFFDEADVIHRYTRAQALADGVLVDVSGWASPCERIGGFVIPVAVSAAVWALLEPPDDSWESVRGHAHDVLWMASLACRADRPEFRVIIGGEEVAMWIHIGPGHDKKLVATIMLEGED